MKTRTMFTIMHVKFQLTQSGLIGTLVLWLALTGLAWWLLPFSTAAIMLAGLLFTLLHWASEFTHQLGHATVARRLGYPMERVRMWYVLAAGLYPKDEPPLPAEIHIRRALGGPVMSLILSVVGVVLVGVVGSQRTRPSGDFLYYLALFFTLENFFVFFLGAFLPLGFTDGSTLLEWWPKRSKA